MTRKRTMTVLVLVSLWTLLLPSTALAADRTGRYVGINSGYASVTGIHQGGTYTYGAGTMRFQIHDGDLVPTFCTDLKHGVTSSLDYAATEEELRCEIVWLLQHYPPDLNGDPQEMAARQAAVWHFSDGFDPVGPGHSKYTEAVEGRAWELIQEAEGAACEDVVRGQPNLVISPLNASQPQSQTTIDYSIEALIGDASVAGLPIDLDTSFGVLSDNQITTGEDGTATFSLTNDVGGPANAGIVATAAYTLGVGTAFKVIDGEDKYQWLVLGEETRADFFAEASAAWLPDGSVTAHVFHDLNMDGLQGDDDEIDLDGWTVTLYQADGAGGWTQLGSRSTAADGTAAWDGLEAGDYEVRLALKSGWHAATPIEVAFSLPASGSRYVDLGVIKMPVITACKFYDGNEDGERDAGEPWLDGWIMAIVDGPGALQGQSGQTENGCVVFSWPRNSSFVAGDYVVAETMQDGWFNSTPVRQTVTLASSDLITVTFGNYEVPDIALEKVGPEYAREGDLITYYFTVTNVGDVELSGSVSDPLLPDLACSFADLAPDATRTCQADYTVPMGGLDPLLNTATVDAHDVYGRVVEDSDDHSVDIIHPAIELAKTATPETVAEGEPVEWSITVYNRGDVTLNEVTVADSNGMVFGPLTLTADDGDDEEGTDQYTWTYETNPMQDVTNLAEVAGVDELGMVVTGADQASVVVTAPSDSDGDGIPDESEGSDDADGDGTPNFLDLDSDGDGIPDEVETADDADGDGTPNFLDLDSDGDGIPDAVETADDADGDGTPNFLDLDSDGDGIPDAVERADDADGDGTPNFLDLDSDGDGIPDAVEAADDADGDGTPNFLDLDSDGDGIPDAVEMVDDADGDGTPNFLDADSDADGIPDSIEAGVDPDRPTDSDDDGTPDYLDLDSDQDGIPDAGEWSEDAEDALDGCGADSPICFDNDADGDGIPNYVDSDSDGDTIPDSEEGLKDSDEDGIPDWLDPNPIYLEERYYLFLPMVSNGR